MCVCFANWMCVLCELDVRVHVSNCLCYPCGVFQAASEKPAVRREIVNLEHQYRAITSYLSQFMQRMEGGTGACVLCVGVCLYVCA